MYNKSRYDIFLDFFIYVIIILLSLACLLPFTHIVFASFSNPESILSKVGIYLVPDGFTTKGYELVFRNRDIWSSYRNTLVYVLAGTGATMVVTTMAGYALSRKILFGNAIMFVLTFTILFSGGLVPFYLLVVDTLGWRNSMFSVIVPGTLNVFHMIILRTSFKTIPDSLIESAKMDGAHDFMIFVRIILPLSTATLAVIALFNAVGRWNEWFNALIFLNDRRKFPLQLVLREIIITNDTSSMVTAGQGIDYASMDRFRPLVRFCTIVVATLPIMCIYPFLQKYFIKGVMIGSIKE